MPAAIKRKLGRGVFALFFLVPVIMLVEIPVFLAGAGLGAFLVYSKDLPEIPRLATYQPRTVSTFYADDGTVIGVFYKQKRVVVDLDQIPIHVINAFLAAEDRRFFEHSGVDWTSLLRAAALTAKSGRISQGGSTITMQVTRNFFLTRKRTMSRKIKEMILARQLEQVWGKDKILHIYLNEIYLGEGAYGVEAASRGYFDKPVQHLTIPEAAMIAGLVASPVTYNPFKNMELATQRQATVLIRMLRAGFITEDQYNKFKEEPLRLKKEIVRPFDLVPDFAEAVRKYIVKHYGEEKLYNEGLKVFTTCKIDFQRAAKEAVDKGIAELRSRQKQLAILRTIPKEQINELLAQRRTPDLAAGKVYQGVVTKVVTPKKGGTDIHVSLNNRLSGLVRLEQRSAVYKVGMVLAIRFERFAEDTAMFSLDETPQLQSALVCIENNTGYVRALVGGVSSEHFQFNRAVQAKRQPGSAFKPIIYSAALEEKSYSPATTIVDEPIVVDMEKDDEEWEPRNSGGDFLGPISFRRALELSRNICTIKILMDVGFDPVVTMARKMGIGVPLGRNLSLSLGTSEMSLFELTSAYTVFPNNGVHVNPVMVKRIEDRFGDVLEDNTQVPLLDDSLMPKPVPREEFRNPWAQGATQAGQNDSGPDRPSNPEEDMGVLSDAVRVRPAMSPQTAYIMTQLLQGGVRSGTGARMSQYLKRKDLAGKTGTTNNAEDTWFIGFNPDYTAGIWVGFDEKRPLGPQEAGGRAALPIWGYFMRDILANHKEKEFPMPPDISYEDVLTYVGSPKDGFQPKMVREPIYAPFAGKTLVLSPLDPPETLATYLAGAVQQPQYPGQPPGYPPPPGAHAGTPQPYGPVQPGQGVGPLPPTPIHPMDGRNLFPEHFRRSAPPPSTAPMAAPGGQPSVRPPGATDQMGQSQGQGNANKLQPAAKAGSTESQRSRRSKELRSDSKQRRQPEPARQDRKAP